MVFAATDRIDVDDYPVAVRALGGILGCHEGLAADLGVAQRLAHRLVGLDGGRAMKTVVVITLEFEHEDDIDMNAIARRALDAGSVHRRAHRAVSGARRGHVRGCHPSLQEAHPMSTIHTRIVYRGTRSVVVDPRLDLWAPRTSRARRSPTQNSSSHRRSWPPRTASTQRRPSPCRRSSSTTAPCPSRVSSDGAWLRSL